MDTFICGTCQGAFNDIEMFMQHKQAGCTRPSPDIIQVHVDGSGEVTEVTGADAVMEDGSSTSPATLAFLNEMNSEGHLTTMQSQDGEGATHTFIILNEGGSVTTDTIQLDPVPEGSASTGEVTRVIEAAPVPEATEASDEPPKKVLGRRRRSKKATDVKVEPMEAVSSSIVKPTTPEKDKDGKLRCPSCHRIFNKERHFKTHKCLATSFYIDISKREVKLDSGDEDELEETEAGAIDDDQEEYRAPPEAEHSEDSEIIGEEEEGGAKNSANTFKNIQLHTDADAEPGSKDRSIIGIEDVPIFRNDEEKLEFEQTLNVDLSCIDHMFKVHVINQDINENAGSYGRGQMSSLSIYSCTVCEKVFKTLSHMRLHCLVHTDLKPFRCNKCQYTTNTKGNLYTHMRKHTGQFYQCKHCEFRSVNKSHLVEHEATHDKKRHPCAICQKDYATGKSLINHVRKYHSNSRKGQQYLQTFLQGRQASGSAVIHQCHVCNRKFKKKIDRDRHLFVHDIRDMNMTHQCELCEYQSSRRVYLEKHYLKHRVLYCCCLCPAKFLSTIKLLEHLSSSHSEEQPLGGSEDLFERCINHSLYLPEPDDLLAAEDKQFVNLPPELSSSAVNTNASSDDNAAAEMMEAAVPEASPSLVDSAAAVVEDSNPATTHLVSQGGGETVMSASGDGQVGCGGEAESLSALPGIEASAEMGDGGNLLVDKEKLTDMDVSAANQEGAESSKDDSQVAELVTEEGVSAAKPEGGIMVKEDAVSESQGEGQRSSEDQALASAAPNPSGGEMGTQTPLEMVPPSSSSSHIPLVPNPGGHSMEEDFEPQDGMEDEELGQEPGADSEGDAVPPGVEEEGEGGQVREAGEKAGEGKRDVVELLGFRKMNMQIFQKMRETFGSEECEYCGRLFYTKQDYEPHFRTHTGDRPYQCSECSFRSTTRENLRRHIEREHENVKFPCKNCDFVATSRTKLWNHQLSHLGINGLQCPHCPEKLETIKRLRVHMSMAHPDLPKEELDKLTGYKHKMHGKMGRRSYKCPYCERVFIRANSELQKHIWIHEGVKPFKCSLCTYACRSKNNLQAHMLRHSSHKPFACQECGKAYKSKTALRWHVRSHKTGNLFKCYKCSYEAQQRSHLKRHMETHEVVKRFVCQHCEYSANTAGYMKIHYARAHKGLQYSLELQNLPASTANSNNDHQVFKCLSCDYLFGNLSDLKRHLKIRHHVQVQDIAGIEQMQISEVEVVQCSEETPVTERTEVVEPATQLAPAVTETVSSSDLDEKTASAVTLLQQIINMQSQGAFGQQEIKVMSDDGQLVAVNPETIIVQQQDGQQVLVTNGHPDLDGAGQYVIQYVAPSDDPSAADVPAMEGVPMEIQTVDATTESVEFVTQ